MSKNFTKENIRKAIAGIKHPAINHTLLDLGIIKDINKDFWLWSRMHGRVIYR